MTHFPRKYIFPRKMTPWSKSLFPKACTGDHQGLVTENILGNVGCQPSQGFTMHFLNNKGSEKSCNKNKTKQNKTWNFHQATCFSCLFWPQTPFFPPSKYDLLPKLQTWAVHGDTRLNHEDLADLSKQDRPFPDQQNSCSWPNVPCFSLPAVSPRPLRINLLNVLMFHVGLTLW